jgi:hypothetical protein
MACTDGITAAITSNCTTMRSGGLEVEAYIFNREDVTLTYDVTTPNKITGIANVGANKCYKVKGIKKLFDAGFDLVSSENRPDKFAHFFKLEQFEVLAEDVANVDAMDDVVIVVNRRDKTTTGEGVFVVLGPRYGLFKSSDEYSENENNGARVLEYKSMAGQEEEYSEYTLFITSYAETLWALEALY